MRTKKIFVSLILIILIISSCGDGYLRGYVEPSKDGKTYLVIVDDNGGGCGDILVDNKLWNHKINEPGLIEPGVHKIYCGGEIKFNIPEGVIFYFDYWGP